jgi:hypothetical protein
MLGLPLMIVNRIYTTGIKQLWFQLPNAQTAHECDAKMLNSIPTAWLQKTAYNVKVHQSHEDRLIGKLLKNYPYLYFYK